MHATKSPVRGPVTSWALSLFRCKPMLSAEAMLETPLKRTLTVWHIFFFGVGFMVGAGIYVLSARVIGLDAGAAACLSYLLAGVACIFTAMCYTELGTLFPRAGSVYLYTFLTLGELPAFVIGWTTISDNIVSMAAIAKAFSGTVDLLAQRAITNWTIAHLGHLAQSPGGALASTYDLVAVGLLLVMTLIVATGAQSTMVFNAVVTAIQLACLAVMTVGCYVYGSPASFSTAHGGFAPNGLGGIISGAAIVIFAYSGFESLVNATEEMVDPVRDIPRAMVAILISVICIYMVASLGLAFLVPRDLIEFSSPYVSGFQATGAIWLVVVAATGTLLATGATKVTELFTISRVIYAMGADGLIFSCFGMVERRTQVPQFSLFFGAVVATAMALVFNIETLAQVVSMGLLFSFVFAGIDVIYVRYWMTEQPPSDCNEEKTAESADGVTGLPVSSRSEMTVTDGAGTRPRTMQLRPVFGAFGKNFPSIVSPHFFVVVFVSHVAWAFIVAIILSCIGKWYSDQLWAAVGVSLLLWAITAFGLSLYEPSSSSKSYQSPLMPMAPVMTILINAVLILRLSALTWARFGIWTALGFLIYFAYGRRHSVARHREGEYTRLEKPEALGNVTFPSSYGTRDSK